VSRERELPDTVHGRSPFLAISAAQKAVRRGQPEPAAAFAIELVRSGYGAWWWRRAHVMACEDISPAATGLPSDLRALHEHWKQAKGKGDLHLLAPARAAVALALAPKSRIVDWTVIVHAGRDAEPVPIPDEARDMHTLAGRKLGRGKQHFADEAGRLIEWEGDLAALEADVRERAVAVWLADVSGRPDTEPPDDPEVPPSPGFDQLRIEPEGDR
jgi:replication-associated recombination protein RarA